MADKIYYKDGYKYQLETDYTHQTTLRPDQPIVSRYLILHTNGELHIKEGYCWDGPSGGMDTKNFMRGSLVHDALCQLINDGQLNKKHQPYADALLHEIIKEDGMSPLRAWWVYRAVRRYDKIGLKQYQPKEVMTAP